MKITTKKYVDNQICWQEKLFTAEIRSIRDAVNKVEQTNSRAIDKVEKSNELAVAKFDTTYRYDKETQNEWRGQFKDQTGTFVTRRELLWAVGLIVGMLIGVLGLILSK